MRAQRGAARLFRSFSARLLAVAGGLLLVAGLIVVLSVPARATPGSAAAHRNAPGAQRGRDRVAREAFFIAKRGLNFGIPAGAYRRAIARMRRQEKRAGLNLSAASSVSSATSGAAGVVPLAWNSIGPTPLLNETPAFAGTLLGSALAGATGKVTALIVDPTISGRMFVEVGSGEGNGAGDSYYGQGVFVTSDLGSTWTQFGASKFAHASVAGLAIDTTRTPRTIYAAITYGSSANRADASWVAGN